MPIFVAIVIAIPLAALVLTPWLVVIDRERAALAELRKRLHRDAAPDSEGA
jgi:hypothetical protein